MKFFEREYYDFELLDGTLVDIYVPELSDDIDNVDYDLYYKNLYIDEVDFYDDKRIMDFLKSEFDKEVEALKR